MIESIDTQHSQLEEALVGRSNSLFGSDLDRFGAELTASVSGARLLMIGAAGSIGSETLRTLVRFRPSAVHVVDHNENGLAELTRTLHSAPGGLRVKDYQTLPFDYGGAIFQRWLEANPGVYDYVLNFAALKHVRSETDVHGVLAMLDTNVRKVVRLRHALDRNNGAKRVFSVSTDKAANPASMMGATKRLMEHAVFCDDFSLTGDVKRSSARFANVALSNGSLLRSWQLRLQSDEPLACPKDCRRYFVSLKESGHLCTLAAVLPRDQSILIPALEPSSHLVLLEDLLGKFLAVYHLQMRVFDDVEEAKLSVQSLRKAGQYPVVLTPLDTAGEKPYEEFVGLGEAVEDDDGFTALRRLQYRPPKTAGSMSDLVEWIDTALAASSDEPLSMKLIHELICAIEPEFESGYQASELSLDKRL